MAFLTSEPKALITTPQTMTNAWADVGVSFPVGNYSYLAIKLALNINDSQNVRIRALGLDTKASLSSTGASFPIYSPAADKVEVAPHYYEFSSDADQKIVVDWSILRVCKFIIIQMYAVTPGAAPATVDSCEYILGGE